MSSQVKNKLLYISKEWPYSKLRPNLQFKSLINSINDRCHLYPKISQTTAQSLDNLLNDKYNNKVKLCIYLYIMDNTDINNI